MHFKSIRTKLVVFICILTAACTLLLQAVNLLLLDNAFNRLVPAALEASLQNAHTQIQAKLDANFSSLETIARMPAIQDTSLTLKERAATLKDFIAHNGGRGYVATAITDTTGKAVLTSGYEINVSGDAYFQEAIQGKNVVSDPFHSVATGDLIIVYAVPYYDTAGKIAGVITLDTDALHLSRDFTVNGIGDTGVAFAITREGNTVVSTDIDTVTGQMNDLEAVNADPALEGLVESEKRMVAGETGSGEHVYDGERELIYFMPIAGTTWSLGVTQTRNEAFQVLNTISISGLIVLLVMVGLGVAAAVAMARSISRPIIRLVDAASGLAVGDTASALALEVGEQDEIGRLIGTFLEMSRSIEEQAKIVGSVAEGDLTVTAAPRSERDTLSIALGRMLDGNNRTLGEVNRVAEKVAAGADQISQGSQSLAQACTEQTVSVDHIGTEIAGMEERILGNLKLTGETSALSAEVERHLRASGESMGEMIASMEDIRHSSDSIAGVIKVIDDIAFQTNILALNAAVEAARAGVHGKGFAVVADEVRNLAAKSAEAARETSELIQASIGKVGDGARIAVRTGDSMSKLTGISEKIIAQIAQIETASEEQAAGISQINEGIEQINSATQQSAAAAEQSASSAQELLEMARQLSRLIARYRLTAEEMGADTQGGDYYPLL